MTETESGDFTIEVESEDQFNFELVGEVETADDIFISETAIEGDNVAELTASVTGEDVFAEWSVDVGDGYSSISGELIATS